MVMLQAKWEVMWKSMMDSPFPQSEMQGTWSLTLRLKGRIICSLTGYMGRTYRQIIWADLLNLLIILLWVNLVAGMAS